MPQEHPSLSLFDLSLLDLISGFQTSRSPSTVMCQTYQEEDRIEVRFMGAVTNQWGGKPMIQPIFLSLIDPPFLMQGKVHLSPHPNRPTGRIIDVTSNEYWNHQFALTSELLNLHRSTKAHLKQRPNLTEIDFTPLFEFSWWMSNEHETHLKKQGRVPKKWTYFMVNHKPDLTTIQACWERDEHIRKGLPYPLTAEQHQHVQQLMGGEYPETMLIKSKL